MTVIYNASKKLVNLFIIFISFQTTVYAQHKPLIKVKLQLQWKYQFQFAGFIIAKELGYYKDVGLDVDLIEDDGKSAVKKLDDRQVDYIILNNQIIHKNKQLAPITLIATYFQRSPLVIVSQPNIKSALDLKGKKVMINSTNRLNSSLGIMLEYFGINTINTTFTKQSYNLNDFIDKKVDAVSVFRSNELYELNKKHIKYNIIDPYDYGFSTNAISLFTSYSKVQNNPQQIKDFVSATKKGWLYAINHIDEVAKLIRDRYNPNLSVEHLIYEGKITKELMLETIYDIGEINEEFLFKSYRRLIKSSKIGKEQLPDRLFFDLNQKQDVNNRKIYLSDEEKEYIKKYKTITFTGDPNWLPYEAFDKNGNYIGIVSQNLDLIEKMSGLKFDKIVVSSWEEALSTAMSGQAKVISGDGADKILNQKFNKVSTYSKNPIVIVMGYKHNYVEDLQEIKDKKIAIIKDYGYTADIFKKYPNIEFIEVANIDDGLNGVANGTYDAMLATNALATYTIAQKALNNIKIVGKTPIIMNLTLFVSKNEPILFDIINKSIKNISKAQESAILQEWVQNRYVEKIDYSLAIEIGILFLVALFIVLMWLYQMQKELKKRLILQAKLQKSENRYRAIYTSNLAIHLLSDPETQKIVDCNETAEKFYSYTREEILDMYIYDINTMSREEIQKEIKNAKALKKSSFHFKHRLADGTIKDVELYSAPIEIEDKTYLYSIIFDITHQKEAEEEVERQHKFLQTIIDSISSGIMVINRDFSVSLMNSTARDMINKNFISNPAVPKCYEITHHRDTPCEIDIGECPMQHTCLSKAKGKYIHTHKSHNDEDIVVEITTSPILDENDEVFAIIESIHDITELKTMQNKLRYQAQHDTLTNLPNRMLFSDRIEQSIKNAHSFNENLAIVFIDLDHFKVINDTYGHIAGDELLVQTAKRLIANTKESDTVARLGGDEFAIILNRFIDIRETSTIIHDIIKSFQEPIIFEKQDISVTLSIGISIYPQDGIDAKVLIQNADSAMYKAKQSGRNDYQFFSDYSDW